MHHGFGHIHWVQEIIGGKMIVEIGKDFAEKSKRLDRK
jgi:hypothetical protein